MAKICFRSRLSEGKTHTHTSPITRNSKNAYHHILMMSILSATSSKCFPGGQLLGAKFLQLPDQYGHYLPEAPTLLAALLRDCRILGEAVKLLQVIDCKSPLNGEFLSQLQSYELNIDYQHLWKEMTMTNHVTQSCGDNGFG